MAKKKKLLKKDNYASLHKFSCAISLLSLIVMILGGVDAGVDITTVVVRAFVVMIIVGVISRVVIKVLATYEEVNRSQI